MNIHRIYNIVYIASCSNLNFYKDNLSPHQPFNAKLDQLDHFKENQNETSSFQLIFAQTKQKIVHSFSDQIYMEYFSSLSVQTTRKHTTSQVTRKRVTSPLFFHFRFNILCIILTNGIASNLWHNNERFLYRLFDYSKQSLL